MKGKQIRPAGPLDLLALSVTPALTLQLNLARRLRSPYHPLRSLLASWLRPQESPPTLLGYNEGELLACAQAEALPDRASWEIQYLAAWEADEGVIHPLWEALLSALGALACRQRILRLLACLPAEQHLPPFRRAGFVPYAEEMVLRWEGGDLPANASFSTLQPVQQEHLWAVHQLYLSLTPPRVQQAEGRNRACWQPQPGQRCWVWQVEGRGQAYLRCHPGAETTTLELLLDPAHRRQAPALIAHGLREAAAPVYLIVRSYQGELVEVARRLGFRPYAEQVLLAKPLVVPAEQRPSSPARLAERQLGAAPTAPSVGNLLTVREHGSSER